MQFEVRARTTSSDSGFDVLAFTGLVLYLLVAAGLVLIGRQLVKMAKRRQSMA